jgi:uncharacterized protein
MTATRGSMAPRSRVRALAAPSLVAALLLLLPPTARADELDRAFADPRVAALARAAGAGDAATVHRLARDGVDLRAVGREGLTPVGWAIEKRSAKGVQALLDAGLSPNSCVPETGCLLGIAAEMRDPWLLRLLLRNKANPNARNANGEPPLYLAVLSRSPRNLELLLDAGADIDATSENGTTPVLFAALLNRFDLVQVLLDRGADYLKRNRSGLSVVETVRKRSAEADPPGGRELAGLKLRFAAIVERPAPPTPYAEIVEWSRAATVDDEVRVQMVGQLGPGRRLWGVALPPGMCRPEAGLEPLEPCKDIALRNIRELVRGHYGKWVAVSGKLERPDATLFSELTEGLVRLGWLVDLPAESGGYYAEDERNARQGRTGVWQLRHAGPP